MNNEKEGRQTAKAITDEALKITFSIVMILFFAAILYGWFQGLERLDERKQERKIEEAERSAERLELVAEELNLSTKNILYKSNERISEQMIYRFLTEEGEYLVGFENGEIVTLIKDN